MNRLPTEPTKEFLVDISYGAQGWIGGMYSGCITTVKSEIGDGGVPIEVIKLQEKLKAIDPNLKSYLDYRIRDDPKFNVTIQPPNNDYQNDPEGLIGTEV